MDDQGSSQNQVLAAPPPQKPAADRHLHRELTFLPLFLINVANMIGTGIFTTSGLILADIRNPFILIWCWLVGGLLSMTGALCYGELGAMFPRAGGDYVFLRESFGKRTAFLSGWISLWVGFSAPIAAAAIAFGYYLSPFLPSWAQGPLTVKITAITVILAFTWVHSHGLMFGARTQSVLSSLKVFLILLLIGAGAVWGKGSLANFGAAPALPGLFSPKVAGALIFVFFAYSGWNASAYLGGEVKKPARDIPWSIISATVFVTALYVLLNLVYVYAAGVEGLAGREEIGSIAARHLFGEGIGSFFGLSISFCLISTLSAMIMTGPRVYYAMACDRLFFDAIRKVNAERHIPAAAIRVQAAVAALLVVTSTFEMLLFYIGFVLSIFASLTVAGLIVLRIREPRRPRFYKTWGYPWTPVAFILVNVWVVVFCVRGNWVSILWGAVTILSGLLAYEIFSRRASPLLARAQKRPQ